MKKIGFTVYHSLNKKEMIYLTALGVMKGKIFVNQKDVNNWIESYLSDLNGIDDQRISLQIGADWGTVSNWLERAEIIIEKFFNDLEY